MAAKILLLWGDQELQTLWALPALQRLREALPEVHLQLVAGKNAGELLHKLDLVDEHLPLETRSWSPWFTASSELSCLRETTAWEHLREASLVLSWLPDVMGVFSRHLAHTQLGAEKLLQASPFEWSGEAAQLQLGRVLEKLAIFAHTDWQPLLPMQNKPEASAIAASLIVIEPFALAEHEHWPLERWDELLRAFVASHPESKLWVSLPQMHAQTQCGEELRQRWADLPVNWAIAWSLWQRSELMQQASLYWGQNRATSQLALAWEVPSLLLLGMREQELRTWQALGLGPIQIMLAQAGVIGRLSVEEVKESLAQLLTNKTGI